MITDNDLDNETDETADSTTADGGGIANLRKQLAKLTKENAAAKADLAKYQKAEQAKSIGDLLTKHGASPKLAKYVSVEGEPTEQSVKAWLEAEGDAFGWSADSATASAADESDDVSDEQLETAENARRISRATADAPVASTGLSVNKLKNSSFDQLIAAGLINA